MKVWARIRKNNKTIGEQVVEIPENSAGLVSDWSEPIGELCKKLDLSRPLLLDKHIDELLKFSQTNFKKEDFLEPIRFDRLEIELF